MGCYNSKPKTKKGKIDNAPPPKPLVANTPPLHQIEKTDEATNRAVTIESPHTLRIKAIQQLRAQPFQHPCCSVKGETSAFFAEGFVYRIVGGDAWYIYNDTLEYEAHIDYSFAPGSQVVSGERTSFEKDEHDWTTAHVVVYPLETVHFVTGTYTAYRSNVVIKALSDAYRANFCSGANAAAERELNAVRALSGASTSEEEVLQRCAAQGVPYVDLGFPPTAQMLYRPGVDGHEIPEMAMKRPTQYLNGAIRSQADAIVGPVVPHSIEPGHLGDCWLTCAAATLAEDEPAVRSIFAHTRPEERRVGAYRVAVNKSGWWRSVIVDNYLPTIGDVPVFARSVDDPCDLWVSLLQKAYAKVHGSYAAITGGDALQALQDFTGAPVYRFDKEWAAAANDAHVADAFVDKLIRYCESYSVVTLSTPGHNTVSYLGKSRDADPEAFQKKYASVGLQTGYTYYLERVVVTEAAGRRTILLRLHNPWKAIDHWNGAWSVGSSSWRLNPAAAKACDYSPEDAAREAWRNSFWIAFEDAINYFDGGGVVFRKQGAVDYRVKGAFQEVEPSAVLEVTVSAPVEVMLVLSQQDKRGLPFEEPSARFAPIMLSVAKHDGFQYRVDKNSSVDPASPTADYNFVVARDVALVYTFEPSSRPYLVIPRIHSKGVVEGFNRPFVVGVMTTASDADKLSIALKQVKGNNRVFKNIAVFMAERLPSVVCEHQMHRAGELAVVTASSTVCGTPPVFYDAQKSSAAYTSDDEAALSRDGSEEEVGALAHDVVVDNYSDDALRVVTEPLAAEATPAGAQARTSVTSQATGDAAASTRHSESEVLQQPQATHTIDIHVNKL